MIDFDKAFFELIRHEGGYVNDPDDPGGETKYGISKRAYPQVNISQLTKEAAKEIYYRDYWIPMNCDKLDGKLALIVFDMAVNAGTKTATKLLQRSLNILDDGIFGSITLHEAKIQNPISTAEKFTVKRILYYSELRGFAKYKGGWIRRTIETYTEALL